MYFGKSAVIPESIPEANTIAHVGKITLKSQYNPYYVSTFLNCKYGYYQLRRGGIKATRPEIKLVEFPDIVVPEFSENFYSVVEVAVRKANTLLELASSTMELSTELIMDSLAMLPNHAERVSKAVVSFSNSFRLTGRLDAEYYQPKYEDIIRGLNASTTISSLCEIYDENFIPDDNSEYKYIELSNVGANGDISDVQVVQGIDLPSRARRIVRKGQVIVSSIEGSLNSCALIDDDYDGALCSTGFYVIDSTKINSESLLVLFKSKPIQALLKQRCSGTILTAISKDEFLNLPLLIIDNEIQKEIAEKVQESFRLRNEAKQLLSNAVKAVEMAIETDEETAMLWLLEKGVDC